MCTDSFCFENLQLLKRITKLTEKYLILVVIQVLKNQQCLNSYKTSLSSKGRKICKVPMFNKNQNV